MTDRPAPFEAEVVAAVADEHGREPEAVRELLARNQAQLAGFAELAVEDLLYEWRTRLREDPLVEREGDAYYLDPPDHVWRDLLDRLELDEADAALLRAAHARQFAADRGDAPEGALVVAEG